MSGWGFGQFEILVVALSIVCSTTWSIAIDVTTLKGNARAYGIVAILQTTFAAIATLVAVFVAGRGGQSLFIGQLSAATIALLGGVFILKPHLTLRAMTLMKSGLVGAGWISAANVAESAYQVFERNLLAGFASVSDLGIYTHSQQYRLAISAAVKAFARTVWPTTLIESRSPSNDFSRTKEGWNAVYVGLMIVGLVFAAIGEELIAILTNSKFNEAAPLAVLGIAYLLLQNVGKPQVGYMYAHGHGAPYAKISLAAIVVSTVLVVPLIEELGIWGAFVCLCIQQMVMRIGVQIFVARVACGVPAHDWLAFMGFALLLGLVAFNMWTDAAISVRLLELVVGLALLTPFIWRAYLRVRALAGVVPTPTADSSGK
jgi:O-antigen/teichoic acid export membrane protein